MRIDVLTVKNFRCFSDKEFRFDPEMNVLIGQNGIGKTAILEALATASGSWFLGIDGFESRHIRTVDVRLKPISYGQELTFEPQYPVIVRAEGQIDKKHIQWQRTLSSERSRTTHGDVRELRNLAVEAYERVTAGEPVTLPLVAYYGSGRLWRELRDSYAKQDSLEKQARLSRFEGYRDSIDDRVNSRDLIRWLERQAWIAFQEAGESPLFRVVRKAMAGMLEGVSDVRYDPKRQDVIVVFENEEPRPFKNLSDGQRNLLSLTGDLSMRMARLNPQFGGDVLTQTPGIVLIDEIDLHLHPRWQRSIARDLRRTFPKVQFIVTTHSPQIIGEVDPKHVQVINHDGDLKSPMQSFGMDSNFILQYLMDTDERDLATKQTMYHISTMIEQGSYSEAETEIGALRDSIGEFPDLVRLQTRIDRIRLLSE